ncbi:MAG: tellurite resistance TerB family protein [Myxococcales bacterium]|nr:tellurite resistance TerB family protein [Polyangiaceae bacterium]MDW8252001.1 tellurite resistance TerB family protein [Myxococcales bacterium]
MPEAKDKPLERLAPLAAVALAAVEDAGTTEAALDALLEAMFLLALADGELDEEEVRQMAGACKRLLGPLVEADLEGLFLYWSAAIAEEGWERRMRRISAEVAGTALAEPAFRLAVLVALADGRIAPDEAEGIDLMAQALGIRPDSAAHIVQDVVRNLFGARP